MWGPVYRQPTSENLLTRRSQNLRAPAIATIISPLLPTATALYKLTDTNFAECPFYALG